MLCISSLADSQVTVRASRAEDSPAVHRLAALDSAPVPCGPLLLAEVDGRLLAALSLADGRAIADPFEETSAFVEMLRARGGRRTPVAEARRAGRRRRRPAGAPK